MQLLQNGMRTYDTKVSVSVGECMENTFKGRKQPLPVLMTVLEALMPVQQSQVQ